MGRRGPDDEQGSSERKHEKILLDSFSIEDIHLWRAHLHRVMRFFSKFHGLLAGQRESRIARIHKALRGASEKFEFAGWQRVVRSRHAAEPLSTRGSLLDPGGRFNIGDVNPREFKPFPALYVASDKRTALKEAFSQDMRKVAPGKELDFALAQPASILISSVSGRLRRVINVGSAAKLSGFLALVKDLAMPRRMADDAARFSVKIIRNMAELQDALLKIDWRVWPMQFDVPSTSQIFGGMAAAAGLEGIVYPSRFDGHDCIAVFL